MTISKNQNKKILKKILKHRPPPSNKRVKWAFKGW